MIARADVSALILAGGRATRLGGVDKHALVIDGETIFARQERVLAPRVAEILVATGSERTGFAGHRAVADAIAGAGPLAGIAAGLAAATTPWLLVVAGDMPELDAVLVDRMVATAGAGLDAVGIRVGGLPEPLLCLLRIAAVTPPLDNRLRERKLKASALLTDDDLRVAWIENVDPRSVRNINTPDDLA